MNCDNELLCCSGMVPHFSCNNHDENTESVSCPDITIPEPGYYWIKIHGRDVSIARVRNDSYYEIIACDEIMYFHESWSKDIEWYKIEPPNELLRYLYKE